MSTTCFVTGTDSHADTAEMVIRIASYAIEKGLSAAVMKPVQTGSADPMLGGLGRIRGAVPGLLDIPALDACCYSFDGEEQPMTAAHQTGIEIDMRRINGAWQNIIDGYSPDLIIMENCGAPLTPFNDKLLACHIPEKLELPVILVVSSSPEAVNDTLLTLEWFRTHDIETVFILAENPETFALLKNFTEIPVAAGFNDSQLNSYIQEVL